MDPCGLKPKLADFANLTLVQLWQSSPMREHIVLGKHNISRNEENKHILHTDDWTGKYDGVHLYGSQGKKLFTQSVLNILRNSLQTVRSVSAAPGHTNCPQAKYQRSQSARNQVYTIPVHNKFDILGN